MGSTRAALTAGSQPDALGVEAALDAALAGSASSNASWATRISMAIHRSGKARCLWFGA